MTRKITITIGREFGSGGREIGKKLAEQLHIAFYDKELLAVAAKESGISRDLFESNDEKPVSSLLYSLSVTPYAMSGTTATYENMPLNHKMFLAQFRAIQKIAETTSCVFVGRCADYALRDNPDCVNVFIHAPLQYRVTRIKERYEISSGEAKDMIIKRDKQRAEYYNSFADKKWGDIDNYHLSLDSSNIGIDNAVKLIRSYLEMRQEEA